MKFILMVLCSVFLTFSEDNGFDKFYEEINDLYYAYEVYEYENDDYVIEVVKGIFNNEPAYGIVFKPIKEDITLVVKQNDELYVLNEVDGYYSAYALRADLDIFLYLYDEDNNRHEINEINQSKLNKFSKSKFDMDNVIYGNDAGKTFSTLKGYTLKIANYSTIIIIIVSVIVVCFTLVIIKLLYNKKHDKKKLSKDKIMEYVESCINEVCSEEKRKLDDVEIEEEKETEEVKVDYISNLQEHLVSLGYITDYKLLSEKEKNDITVYIMKLKDNKQITEDTYLEEMYKIWKS